MIERNGDIFNTTARFIGHGVNCKGIMGAGIAKTVREKFPQTYLEYKAVCDVGFSPGSYFAYVENDKVIVNLASQNMPGPDARYEWVFLSLLRFARDLTQRSGGGVVAIPEIGCGIGGLHWLVVKSIIECVEQIVPDVTFEVWHYK